MTVMLRNKSVSTRDRPGTRRGLNVRVVSLPDGEDPDSYAQAHTAEEVLEYISGHETDFIHFKTKLLLTQAVVIR